MTEIKPCPNPWGCSGSQAPVCTHYNFDGNSALRHVVCHSCGERGPVRPTEAEAIAAWNQRAPAPSLLNGLREAREALAGVYEWADQLANGATWHFRDQDPAKAAKATLAHLDTLLAQEGQG